VTGTYAYWTDTAPVSGVTISTGTLDLKINSADSLPSYTALNVSNMVPGNSSAAVLTVRNAGTAALTYYADSTASGTLGSAFTVKVTADTATGGSGASKTCPGTALTNSGSSFGNNLIGSSANPRSLAASASESLCVQVTLPNGAASSLQGSSSNITLTFNAEQVH
ncbi:MAG TPA: TasA family protein, partial [Mycobacterium sp.]